jgi:protein SCO1/2
MTARRLALLLIALLSIGAVDPNNPFKSASIDEHLGASIPLDGTFVDQNGKATTLRQIAGGKPLLIVPVQHECPNICSVTLTGISSAIDGQTKYRPWRDFAIVAFGIDPREGPAQARDDMHRLAEARGGDSKWQMVALTGSNPAIHAVTDALGYRYAWSSRLNQYVHVTGTAVLTPDGRLSSWLYGLSPTPAQVDKALAQAAAGKSGGIMQRLILLCCYFDPTTGKYTVAITKVLDAAGVFTVLAIALLVLFLSRKRKRAA